MAQFTYNATFRGKEVAPHLAGDLVGMIETAQNRTSDQAHYVRARTRADYHTTYKVDYGDQRVIVGIRTIPGKVEGTEGLHIDFAGTEDYILQAKQGLLALVPELALR
jgi:hypothetical protein